MAIIMDGNGRWAKARGLKRSEGHVQGYLNLREVLRYAVEFGVEVLTVYAFSTENWHRPQDEVDALMELVVTAVHAQTPELISEGVRLRTIGDLSRLPDRAREALLGVIEQTAHNTRINLVLALSYSSRDEITRAVRALSTQVASSALSPEDITEEHISRLLDTADLPELDLMIRTGGERRISNYLLWQGAYAELYFSDAYWPDFGREDLRMAILDYNERERRWGKTSEQVQALSEEE